MKYITFSRHFPKGHPKEGQPTYFVEKIWNTMRLVDYSLPKEMRSLIHAYEQLLSPDQYLKGLQVQDKKYHTIRPNNRFKPGETVSLRVWSDKPYRSKQIEFAQVEVKKVWEIKIVISHTWWSFRINDKFYCSKVDVIANNDGLELQDFIDWLTIHPKTIDKEFAGQIICWSPDVNY